MVGLVQLLLKSNTASSLVEDYASCLELRSEESHIIENSGDDPGVLIMQVCLCTFQLSSLTFLIFIVLFLDFSAFTKSCSLSSNQ